jgi:FAD/FMN-containing dehydrogenase
MTPARSADVRFIVKIAAPSDAASPITAYTLENFRRLREAKTEYDPRNLLHRNHNIPPLPQQRWQLRR